MTPTRIAELKALVEAALLPFKACAYVFDDGSEDDDAWFIAANGGNMTGCEMARTDAEEVASLCNAVPELLAEIDALKGERDEANARAERDVRHWKEMATGRNAAHFSETMDITLGELRDAENRADRAESALATARAEERERCAKVLDGVPPPEGGPYTEWPEIQFGVRSNQCESKRFALKAAAVLRNLPDPTPPAGETPPQRKAS